MTRLNLKKAAKLGASGAALALAATAAMADTVRVDQGADITELCGSDPIRVALVDGWGGDTWRKITFAELQDEASKCPNITAEDHSDAGGDQQTYSAAINGYATQGYEIIIAFTDFGEAALPTYRMANGNGTTMVPYFNQIPGRVGFDYAVNPYQDSVAIGKQYAEWMANALDGEGNVLMLGGPAGASSSTNFMNGFKEGLAEHPGLTLMDENFIATNWNPADAQKAAAGLIAKYGDSIDGIASDYGVTTLATIKAFKQAGVEVPALATIATSNEMSCMYLEAIENGDAWPYLALDGSTADVRFALRQAVAAHNGIEFDEPLGVVPYIYADSTSGIVPKCSDTAPPDADLSSLLPEEKLNALFQQ
ncbi:substrate-binding domain-containing protein [Celeribacter sp. PS-C1]|uniref:substrate-binding domain-containing protein n=1 Tax=Celeribacter sp. PS-C1 TaxID=2820813 RepID=UPI001CA489DE|nr:substrate-binding domain-containing protein [Celeribacter sp. PS-C1]MBW6418892.1 substrate-binding domain-containing protein [Celeribacter sp. PS-C1]